MRAKFWCLISFLVLAIQNPAWAGTSYSVSEYTDAVLKAQPSLTAQRFQVQAALLDERQADLMTSPQLETKVSRINDRRPPLSLAPGFSSLVGTALQSSVSQQFATGTTAKLTLDLQSINFKNFRLSLDTPGVEQEIHTFLPSIDISQPLWRGAMGRNIAQEREMLAAQRVVQEDNFKVKKKDTILGAELAYYRLAFARDRLAISQTTLVTAEKILAFVRSKRRQNLYEQGDLLQAQALVESRRLEVQEALSEQRSAALSFNAARGVVSETVKEQISTLRQLDVAIETQPVQVENQPELATVRDQIVVAGKAVMVAEEASIPALNAFLSYGLQSRFDDLGKTMRSTLDPYSPVLTVGISLDMALDRDLVKSGAEAARLRRYATQNLYDDLKRALSSAANDLTIRRVEAVTTYKLAKSLESVQDAKLKNEQIQYRNGRSTTYQLLMFSQDLALAELGRVKAAYALHVIDAQLNQFRGQYR